jgi:hypothetical protein
MAGDTPHSGEHGRVFDTAGDNVRVDHVVALGLTGRIEGRSLVPAVPIA